MSTKILIVHATRLTDRAKRMSEQLDKICVGGECYHTYLIGLGRLRCLWSHPAIATQGSFTGQYSSAIKQRRHGFIKLRWYFKLYYKKLLYNLR